MIFRLPTCGPVAIMAAAVVLIAACGGQSGPTAAEEAVIRRVNDRDNTVNIRPGTISDDFTVLVDGRPIHNTSELPADTSLIVSIEITKRVDDGPPQNRARRSTIAITTRGGRHQ